MTQPAKQEWLQLRRQVQEKTFARMNDRQRAAVFETEGPLLVLAGAGSGKTTVLVNRIANLVQFGMAYHSPLLHDGFSEKDAACCRAYIAGTGALTPTVLEKLAVAPCPPWRIMAITFTNKAAGELKDRLCTMLGGPDGEQVWASTFHSSCARMLRRDAERIGYARQFSIYDSDDSLRVMKQCLKDMEIPEKSMAPKLVLGEISRAKDWMKTPADMAKEAGDDFRQRLIAQAYERYQRRLAEAEAMDFDDLLVNTVRLFKSCPEVLKYYQDRFRYLMVDEYQDTNHVQYEFIRLLASTSGNLCVVGDDDQSIYKFRGATIENIMSFEETFSGAKVIKLEQNYRSTQHILNAANGVIQNNPARKSKNLWTDAGEGERVHLHTALNEEDEADWAAKLILDGVAAGRRFADYAVLYRMNSQSLMFERMFTQQGIPYRIIGGKRFYERLEIKDMLAYLHIINNPKDLVRMRRIITRPRRRISERTFDLVAAIAEAQGTDFLTIAADAKAHPEISKAAEPLKKFAAMLKRLIAVNQNPEASLTELFEALLEQTGYIAFLRTSEPEKAEDRIENIGELLSNLQRYEGENPDLALSDFLEEVSLFTDIDNYDAQADAAVMMTIHSAKGLEFPCVFLPGWEEGVFPGNSVIYYPAEAEEERRLAYVAITRAREVLYISCAESRMIFGQTNRNRPSRFAGEIPEEQLDITRSRGSFFGGRQDGFGIRPAGTAGFGAGLAPQSAAAVNFAKNTAPAMPLAQPNTETFQAGDTVQHKTFGTGTVLAATTMANDTLLEIAFEKVGTKKLFANFARLTKG